MWRIVGAALLAAVVWAAPAHADNGQYTHVLCADPSTGRGVGEDGRMPPGISFLTTHTIGADVPTSARCSGAASAGTGLLIQVGIAYSTSAPNDGNGTIVYTPPSGTSIAHALLYIAGSIGDASQKMTYSVHGGDPTNFYGLPRPVTCSWFTQSGSNCGQDRNTPFAAANRIDWSDVPADGFALTLSCDNSTGGTCSPDGEHVPAPVRGPDHAPRLVEPGRRPGQRDARDRGSAVGDADREPGRDGHGVRRVPREGADR